MLSLLVVFLQGRDSTDCTVFLSLVWITIMLSPNKSVRRWVQGAETQSCPSDPHPFPLPPDSRIFLMDAIRAQIGGTEAWSLTNLWRPVTIVLEAHEVADAIGMQCLFFEP